MAHPHQNRLALLIALTCLSGAARAADGPTPYPDAKDPSAWPGEGPIRVHGWMTDNRKYFWTQREKDRGAVVFVGDSLTGNWKGLKDAFPGVTVANRGIGGDTSRGVLFRFKEDVLDLKPRAIVMCVGTNDLSAHGDPAAVERNVAAMLKMVREQDAKTPVVVCLVPPRDVKDAPTKPAALEDLNKRLTELAAGGAALAVLDLFTPLATPEGKPVPEYFEKDRIHIAAPGYAKWAEALKPVLEKMGVKGDR